jgi:hypothetical protein
MKEVSAFGVVHKATEYYDGFAPAQELPQPAQPMTLPSREDAKSTGKAAVAGAAGGTAVLAGAGGMAYKKARPAIKAWRNAKKFLAGKP